MAEVEEIETLSERQENELQALMSIFGTDDVKDLREKDPWKILRPPEILISLLPPDSMHGQEAFVSVNLMVKMPAKYPELVPDLELTNAKGLSNQLLSRLKQELQEEARKLCGEVMILDLCQHIQDFLHIHNKPPFKSFYEEMMSNQKKEREKIAQEQQRKLAIKKKKEEKQFLQIQEEIQKRQDALKEETRRIRNEAKQHGEGRLSMSEPSTPSSDSLVSPIAKDTEQKARSRSSKSPEDQRTPARQTAAAQSGSYHKNERRRRTSTPRCDEDQQDNSSRECTSHRGTHNITFTNKKERTICRGRCIGHSTRGSTMYVGIDIQSGELVAVAEWVLRWRHPSRKLDLDDKIKDENTASKYLKQLVGVEQELFSLAKLKHIHLIKYLAMHYTKDTCKITVHVLMEYAGGGNLNTCLQKNQCVPLEQLRLYTQQLLEALVYLHSKSIVHKDLKSSSVLLDTTGNIRLADYSLNKRLEELYCSVESNRPGVHFAEAKSGTKTSKKDDIYKLGMLVLSLAEGEALTGEVPSVPTSFPAELKDFLEKCLVLDETQRWSANQLLDHTYLKTPIYSKVGTTSKQQSQHTNKNTDGAGDEEEEEEDTDIPFIPRSDSGHSRLKNEFDILKWLGKGGFGDVIKVRNKLDGRYYAIKRIPLNTRSKQFTKKITREVKLLSRLNNENVVRYYNSWIETSDEPAPSDSSATFTDTTSQSKTPSRSSSANEVKQKSVLFHNSLGFVDDIEMNVPAAVEDSIEWSVSISNRDPQLEDDSSSDIDNDDDDDDEEDVFGASFMPYGDSDSGDGIVFEQKSKFEWSQSEDIKEKLSLTAESDHNHKDESTVEARPRLQFLYIQMEFCEKSTLRSCIDMGLYQDPDRVWRFFREIVEGLVHIHEQGMIHRDLKPVNIFMDSNDHVKIGDFGLATTEIISKQQTSLLDLKMNLDKSASMDMRVSSSKSLSMEDSELTGKVGSALYVSPEMLITSTRAHYNQKVDIYSLGVMFFEMCYRPLTTGMERVKILSNIRLPTVDFPEDFDEIELPNQAAIVRWMLNHDPNCRPTAQELLQSELLPPAQMEEAELTEVLRSTIADPNSRSYRHMVNTVLSQPLNPATDFTFDMDLHRGSFHQATHLLQMQVVNTVEKIFRYHSGIRISSPLLMPKSILYEHTDQYVCLMDQSGGLVALPYDLRVPFARYIARNNLNHVKRYNIERVYRQKKLYGLHPRELTECAFDIITNTPTSGLSEAELIQIVNEILMEYPVLQNRNYYIRLNHVSLLKSVLLHCGVPDELHQHVLAILGDTKLEKQGRLQLQTKLCSLSLSDQTIINLYHFIETEGSFGKIASMLRCITKGRGQSAGLAKKALKEMEEIISHAENLGCKLEVTLAIGMVYNIHMWSGVIFQIAANVRRKKKPVMDVLAAGGRYDSLIGAFQRPSSFGTQQSLQPVAAGVSISLDKLTTVVSEDQELQVAGACEALVCSLGNRPSIKDKLQVARSLWAAGICTDIFQDITQSQEEIQDYCRKASIPHLVLLKDLEADTIKVRSFEKEAGKVTEKKLTSINAVIDHIKQALLQAKMDQCELGSASNNKAPSVTSQSSNEGQTSSTSHHTSSNVPSYNVTFLMSDTNKLASNVKRRYESQIYANISSALTHISSRAKVEVIGMEFSAAVLRTIAAYLEVNFDEYAFETSISNIVEKHTRHKKYFIKIFDHIHDLKFTKKCPVILLYGLKDDSYKILL